MKKLVITTCIIILLIFLLSSKIFAISDLFSTANGWLETGRQHTNTTMDTTNLKQTSDTIFNIFFGVGVAVAIVVGAILGIQFMTAGIDQKVEVKKSLFPYIISCFVLFGAFGIWKLIVTILSSI